MSFGRNNARKPARRAAFRKVNKRILVLCEGEKTERQYILGFARKHKDSLVEVKVAREHGVPMVLVRNAKKLRQEAAKAAAREKDRNLRYDEVWCVFDLDEHPNVTNALKMAGDNRIEVALSVPCFELWLILHFRDSPGMIDRRNAQSMLKKYVAGYDKSVKYEDYHEGYANAVRRAQRLEAGATTANEPLTNPSTGVHRLTAAISPPQMGRNPKGRGR